MLVATIASARLKVTSPEQALAAYLRGEPVAAVYQIMREAKNE